MNAKQVVVGYDGSESSRVALTWALTEARARALPLVIAHVLELRAGPWAAGSPDVARTDAEHRDVAQRLLLAAKHESRREVPEVDPQTLVLEGPTVPALLSQLGDAELVVVGSRGLGEFRELLVGSTVVQLVSHAPCPVVVVRSLDYAAPGEEQGRVVVGVDGPSVSDDVLRFGFEEASIRGVGLTAVHAWQVPFVEPSLRSSNLGTEVYAALEAESRSRLAEAAGPWREKFPEVQVRERAIHGNPVAVLVEASTGAALTVVGSRGQGGFRDLLIGSVGHSLVHHTRSALAVVRS